MVMATALVLAVLENCPSAGDAELHGKEHEGPDENPQDVRKSKLSAVQSRW